MSSASDLEDIFKSDSISYELTKQKLPEWHQANRQHTDERPQVPEPEVVVPTTNLRHPRVLHSPVSAKSMFSHEQDSESRSRTSGKRSKHRVSNMPVSGDSRKGWTLAKGWNNRPRHRVVDAEVVEEHISSFADRIQGAQYLDHGLLGSGSFPRLGEISHDARNNPGPRFNLRDAPVRKEQHTVKFSEAKRFTMEMSRSPGPYINTRYSPTVLGTVPGSCTGTPLFKSPSSSTKIVYQRQQYPSSPYNSNT